MATPKLPGENSQFLSWFFELLTMDKVRVIGLLLSASALTWQILTTLARAVATWLTARRKKNSS